MTTPQVENQGRTVAEAPARCGESGCESVATVSYAWDWGATGVVCGKHAAALTQLQDSLQRRVSIAPIQKAGPLPLERDERTRLTALGLVLEEELKEAKDRGLALYRENVALAGQVQRLTVLEREARAQLSDKDAQITGLKETLEGRELEHGELVAELERLRVVASFADNTPH